MMPAPLRILLRRAGQVVFCNNTATGLIVLAALYAGGTVTGLAATARLKRAHQQLSELEAGKPPPGNSSGAG